VDCIGGAGGFDDGGMLKTFTGCAISFSSLVGDGGVYIFKFKVT